MHRDRGCRCDLDYQFSVAGQQLIAKSDLRPISAAVLQKYGATPPPLILFTVEEAFGSWQTARKGRSADGGVFDQSAQRRLGHMDRT